MNYEISVKKCTAYAVWMHKVPKVNFEGLTPFRLYAGAEIKRHSSKDYYIFSDVGDDLNTGPNEHPQCNLLTSLDRKNFGNNTGFNVFSEMKIAALHQKKYAHMKYIRKVIFPDSAHIYVGHQTYLADKIVCGEAELIDRTSLLKYINSSVLLDARLFQYVMSDRHILNNLNTGISGAVGVTLSDEFVVKCLTNDINTLYNLQKRVTEQHLICAVYNPDFQLANLVMRNRIGRADKLEPILQTENQTQSEYAENRGRQHPKQAKRGQKRKEISPVVPQAQDPMDEKLFGRENLLKILLERNAKPRKCLVWIPRKYLTNMLVLIALSRIPASQLGGLKPHFFNDRIMTILLVGRPEAILFLSDGCHPFVQDRFLQLPNKEIVKMMSEFESSQLRRANPRFLNFNILEDLLSIKPTFVMYFSLPVEFFTETVLNTLIEKYPQLLNKLPKALITPELFLRVVKVHGNFLMFIPKQFWTKELCVAALLEGNCEPGLCPTEYFSLDLMEAANSVARNNIKSVSIECSELICKKFNTENLIPKAFLKHTRALNKQIGTRNSFVPITGFWD